MLGWVRAGLGVWEHKSNFHLTFLSLSTGRRPSSSAVNLSGPALPSVALGAPGAGVERCLWAGAAGAGVSLGSAREQDLEPPGRGFGVGAAAVLSVGGEERELFVN